MDKDRGNKFGFFKSFSFRIVIIALLIICAAFLSIIVPLTIYIDIFAIFLLCLIAIIMCIKELKDKKFKLNELSKNVSIIFLLSINLISSFIIKILSILFLYASSIDSINEIDL